MGGALAVLLAATLAGVPALVLLGPYLGMPPVLRLPAASLADANSICAAIKAQGGDCFPPTG